MIDKNIKYQIEQIHKRCKELKPILVIFSLTYNH